MKHLLSKDKKTLILVAMEENEMEILNIQLHYVPGFYFLWRKGSGASPALSKAMKDKFPNLIGIGVMYSQDGFYSKEEQRLMIDERIKHDKELIEELKLNKLFKGLI